MTRVTAAIIQQDGKYLICQRPPNGSCANLWEFPGGKLEAGEALETCIIRECLEELNITIVPEAIFQQFFYQDTLFFTFFMAHIDSGVPQKNVHQEIRWVPLDELNRYDFCPADIEIVADLHAKFHACTNSGNDI